MNFAGWFFLAAGLFATAPASQAAQAPIKYPFPVYGDRQQIGTGVIASVTRAQGREGCVVFRAVGVPRSEISLVGFLSQIVLVGNDLCPFSHNEKQYARARFRLATETDIDFILQHPNQGLMQCDGPLHGAVDCRPYLPPSGAIPLPLRRPAR